MLLRRSPTCQAFGVRVEKREKETAGESPTLWLPSKGILQECSDYEFLHLLLSHNVWNLLCQLLAMDWGLNILHLSSDICEMGMKLVTLISQDVLRIQWVNTTPLVQSLTGETSTVMWGIVTFVCVVSYWITSYKMSGSEEKGPRGHPARLGSPASMSSASPSHHHFTTASTIFSVCSSHDTFLSAIIIPGPRPWPQATLENLIRTCARALCALGHRRSLAPKGSLWVSLSLCRPCAHGSHCPVSKLLSLQQLSSK